MFRPKYTITPIILGNIAKAAAAREVIENAPLIPAWEVKFRQEALIRTVHHGTHIEGNPLNLDEAKQVLEGREVEAKDRDVQEIINYRNVLKFIDKFKTEFEKGKERKITEEDFLHSHKLITDKVLPKDQSGHYRELPVVVRNERTKQVSFTPPMVHDVPYLVKDFLTWLNFDGKSTIHPIIKAGITHYELARIHPFIDGNGRAARAISTLVLFLEDYDVKRFFSLEEYYDRNSHKYYEALQKVSNQRIGHGEHRDLTPWLEYFTQGLALELVRIKEKVLKLSSDAKLKGKVGQLALSERQAKLVEYIQDYGQISNKDWRRLLPHVSDDTILRDLKDLINKKLIKKKGKTKAAVYVLK